MSNSGLIVDFWGTFLMERSQIFIVVLILSKGREQVVGSIHWFSYISPELHHTFLVYAKIVRNISHSEQRKCVDARDVCYLSLQHTGVQAASGAGLFSPSHGYVFYQHTAEQLRTD